MQNHYSVSTNEDPLYQNLTEDYQQQLLFQPQNLFQKYTNDNSNSSNRIKRQNQDGKSKSKKAIVSENLY